MTSASGNTRNGRCATAQRPFLLLLLLILAAMPAASRAAGASLVALEEIAGAGAPGLALSLMDDAQPSAADAPSQWSDWEKARIGILEQARAWQRAIDRLANLPPPAPEPFRRWALAQRAAFHLELQEARAGRALLRELVWNAGPGAAADELKWWRRLIVQSYLVEHRVEDAVTALRRFDQDYRGAEARWPRLRTRVLLRADRPEEAVARLPESDDDELRALAMLARLRAERVDPQDIWSAATQRAAGTEASKSGSEKGGISDRDRARFWFVAMEAAGASDSGVPRRALAAERAVALADTLPQADTVFTIDGDALWSAWLDYGRWYGNRQQLLIGDDEAWFDAAEAAMPKFPVRSRALLATVAQHGGGSAARRRAHQGLVARLEEGEPGMAAVRQVYLHSSRYPEPGDIPEIVRYRLVDHALARDDLELGTRLLTDLGQAPPGVEPFDWRLLRARVLVLGGATEDGVTALSRLLGDSPELEGERLDRFLQIVFDLQGGSEHEAALRLLRRLALRQLPGKRQRELLYWQAESHEALEQYRRAAHLYMRSATLIDGKGGDPWGQTARYQAARMLAQAGLVSDARRIYEQLLRVTEDPNRRSTLRHRLQQLGLRAADPANVPLDQESRR